MTEMTTTMMRRTPGGHRSAAKRPSYIDEGLVPSSSSLMKVARTSGFVHC